jgi:parallel beta-helix repeat protein
MATVPYTFANAPGGSSIPLEELDANFAALQGQLGPTGPTGARGTDGTSSSIYYYKANTVSTSGDPGLGYLSWNSTTQISSNIINLSHQTSNVVDIDIFLSLLEVGQELIIQDVTSSGNFQKWTISGSVTNINPNATNSYYIVPVTLTDSGGVGTSNFPGNAQIFLAIASNPPGPTGPTGSSVTGPTGATGSTGPAGISTPAGSIGQVQFNNSSVLGADSNLFWDNTNKRLGVGTSSPQYPLEADSVGTTAAILGKNTSTGAGIQGQAVSGSGVIAISSSGDGIVGQSSTGYAGTFYGKVRAPNVYNNSVSGRNVVITSSGEFGYGSSIAVTPVTNVAALRALPPVNGQVVYLSGYNSTGDGGGGTFYGVTGGSTFTDNGGVFFTTAYGVASTSAWIRADIDPINILFFGALTGSSNASVTRTAIQNAINYVGSVGGGTIYVPKGTFYIDQTLTISAANITLAGDNMRASCIATTSTTITMLNITGSGSRLDTAQVQNLRFYRNATGLTNTIKNISVTYAANVIFSYVSSDNGGQGYYANDTQNTQFYNCRVANDSGTGTNSIGWYVDSSNNLPNASIAIVNSSCISLNTTLSVPSYGIFVYGQQVKDIFIRGFESATNTYGIWIEETSPYQNNYDVTITDCVIDTYYAYGIVLKQINGATVANCWTNPATGATNNNLWLYTCRNIAVTGCEFFAGGNFSTNVALQFGSSVSCNVTGNTFMNNRYSIAVDGSSGLNTITGNSFYNLGDQPADAQVQVGGYRNSVSSNSMNGTANYAIQLSSASNYNVVIGNVTNALPITNLGAGTNLIPSGTNIT